MLILFISLLMVEPTSKLEVITDFDQPGEAEAIELPYSMCFAPDGKLFLLDARRGRIFVWNTDGSFSHAFGREGKGPGELREPINIFAGADRVWVWESSREMTSFSHDGTYLHAVRVDGAVPRNFAVLDESTFLLGHMVEGNHQTLMKIEARGLDGKQSHQIKHWKNESQLSAVRGEGNLTLKAFAPELDVQRDSNGNWWVGFSQDRVLYRLDAQGNIIGKRRFELPANKPSKEEKLTFGRMSFPLPNGFRVALEEFPEMKFDFSYDKAFYTQFLISGDKIAFVLTPVGSFYIPSAWSSATYYVCDFKTGKVLHRGAYTLPEDSRVFYRNGHALAVKSSDEFDYTIQEIKLEGM
jgi:hypothetical protein